MSDCHDVEQVLVDVIAQTVYPAGTANPSIAGVPCVIRRGWPVPAKLDSDLNAGTVNISVYPMDNEQKTTRYPKEWQTLALPAVSLTLTVSGTQITVGGLPASPLNARVTVNGINYVYPVQASDSLTGIATALATLVNADTPATSSGAVVTVPGGYRISAFVGGVGTTIRETKRQKRTFMVTFWCPSPALRDLIAPPVDAALADIDFLSLPDGSSARLIYEKTRVSDRVEREGLYRRDLFYSAEYPTTDTQNATQIVATLQNVTQTNSPP